MRAVKIKISGELLLELIGLEPGDIRLHSATVEWPNRLELTLTGEDERLPEIKDELAIPDGIVICKRLESYIKVEG